MQTVFPLAPDAAVALTVAKYLTPSGRSIQRDYSQIDDYLLLAKRAPDASPKRTAFLSFDYMHDRIGAATRLFYDPNSKPWISPLRTTP